ncbi:hypothetical protein O6H91_05G039800 [Diphasiastrum complanatum]|uniref:Uncharacterized protein n=1 Tax=Diphasiastrum complanatum TaxID=34168 RepID=A0ACC2DMY4_DIPCM|nr:hypothetical protein O6H91_05G039800 [Diphasiastrum complanatum]
MSAAGDWTRYWQGNELQSSRPMQQVRESKCICTPLAIGVFNVGCVIGIHPVQPELGHNERSANDSTCITFMLIMFLGSLISLIVSSMAAKSYQRGTGYVLGRMGSPEAVGRQR